MAAAEAMEAMAADILVQEEEEVANKAKASRINKERL